ncbi:helix-turn-helix domain-containing protein [Micromonospora olivasterospora]|uniref:DNA-binding PucR family transcriptional regulator n=1 Tax=Micromonospora olivasterospora TaxID=1880 RepID=A0A562IJ90_MICOL|nr:helix-turn-helix domain-containing protein [Micromonospora olivasterospora]TWH70896.1 DNA-binding PucR family transcriptional regulator [Micromonospora olivasterospora]
MVDPSSKLAVGPGRRPTTGGVDAVLALLDGLTAGQEVPADVLDRLTEGGTAAQGAELRRRVGEVHAAVSRWRRRDQQLSALFSSARELAELRSVGPLLDRLVQRAHDLVGSDVMYLSEFDQGTGELRVSSTLGAITEAFRRLRVPPGAGLASEVAQTRAPRWISGYPTAHVRHDPQIDAAVAGEGLVSLLGVPLLAGSEVLGVLFAAYRSDHRFTADEVALLSAFADHAAVVLQTVELLEIAHRSAREAEKASAEAARHAAAVERAAQVHEELTAVVLGGGDAGGIAATLSRALRRAVVITDRSLTAVAATDANGSPVPLSFQSTTAIAAALDESSWSGQLVEVPSADVYGVAAAVAGRSTLGAIIVGSGAEHFGAVDKRTVERAGLILALQTLQQDAVVRAEEQVRGELLADLLDSSRPHDAHLRQRARARHVDLQAARVPIAVWVRDDDRPAAVRALQDPAVAVLAGEQGALVAVLSPDESGERAGAAVARRVRTAIGREALVVVGRPGALSDLAHRWSQAADCVRLLDRLGVASGVTSVDAYAPYLALFGDSAVDVKAFTRELIGPVLTWDAERRTELLETLALYLDQQGSPARTARALGVHVNTVLQRLDRVDELLGADWRTPERRFRVAIAVRLHRLVTI